MPDSLLAGRLARIKMARAASGKKDNGPVKNVSAPRCVRIPGWERISEFLFKKDTENPSPFASSENGSVCVYHPDAGDILPEDLLFYDLETTGLSSGAGVVAFLAGFGRIERGRLVVSQYFMSDFPGERDFLEYAAKEIAGKKILVSYNGMTFDRHLLISRFLMNGLMFPGRKELDLLHVSRRLWKEHIPSCSLESVEKNILGINRIEDVSGRYIPDLYFSFLKSGSISLLDGVFAHHLQDIVSLSEILRRISVLWKNPEKCTGGECYSLGKYMLSKGKPEGEELLVKVLQEGGAFSFRAGISMGYHYKRSGRIEDAVNVWLGMWEKQRGFIPGIELAKYYEHKCRDYRSALDITDELVLKFPSKGEELYHRRKRLLRKLERSARF